MMYSLYATMRSSGEIIKIVEWDKLEFMIGIMNQFNEGKNIKSFHITDTNGNIIEYKELPEKIEKSQKVRSLHLY